MRPNWDEYFSKLCVDIAERSVCIRHKFGAIVVSGKNEIISTGYNGPVRGALHCVKKVCGNCANYPTCRYAMVDTDAEIEKPGCFEAKADEIVCIKDADNIKSGTGHQECPAVHAEQNALLQAGRDAEDGTLYINAFPCKICARLIVNAKIKKVVVCGEYTDKDGLKILTDAGIELINLV